MAFIDIQDPVKREEIVQDYIKNIREIREKKESQKLHGMTERKNIEKVFQPVVQATEKSASQITNEIKNLKEQAPETLGAPPMGKAVAVLIQNQAEYQ